MMHATKDKACFTSLSSIQGQPNSRRCAVVQMRSDSDGDLSSISLIELNFNWSQLLKVAVTFGLQQVPYAGGLISGIVGVLWPVDKPDVWTEIKQRAEELVNRKLEEAIWK